MTPAIPSERDRADTAKACLLDLNATTTTVGHQPDPMMELLESKKFRDDIDPPTEDPVITCRGLTLGTAGNIGNIQGKTKTAKTTGPFQCILASAMGGSGDDVLDFAVNNPDRLPVTYLDLEMSNYHFYRMVRGAMDRAGITKLPPWVRAYSLTELSATKRMEALQRITDEPHRMVMVDGWSDLMQDINDLERATIFADEIQARVIAYDFHIAGVLHENPSGGSGSKMWTPLCRNRPIMESEAIGMTYDERRGMFVKASNKAAIRAMDKQEEMIRTLIEVSRGDPNSAWRYAELVERIMDVEKKSEPTAKRRVKELVGINLIFQQTGTGYYHLVSLVKDRINGTRGQ